DGVAEANSNPDFAAQVLVDNEPLFEDLGIEATKESLSWVYWSNLEDNARMFGLDGQPAVFDSVFTDASEVWKSLGVIQSPIEAAQAKDDSFIQKMYEE
ncbi:MAG: OmpA/MotB protein, partial [uncultured bacterium]